jgi:hypothetical protein
MTQRFSRRDVLKAAGALSAAVTLQYPCHRRDDTDSWNYPQLEKFEPVPFF